MGIPARCDADALHGRGGCRVTTLRGLHDEAPIDVVAVLRDRHRDHNEAAVALVDPVSGRPRRRRSPERPEILTRLAEQSERRHDAGGYR